MITMKRCVNCGKEIEDHIRFCPGCGTAQPAAQPQPQYAPPQPQYAPPQPQYAPPQPQYAPPQPQYANPMAFSDWDGTVLDTFVNSLVASLIMSFTCGIATPWAVVYMMKYIIGHATIGGKRLVFTGDGGSLFGQWIVWFLLTAVTCGIYSFWVAPKMYKWICSHIQFAN